VGECLQLDVTEDSGDALEDLWDQQNVALERDLQILFLVMKEKGPEWQISTLQNSEDEEEQLNSDDDYEDDEDDEDDL